MGRFVAALLPLFLSACFYYPNQGHREFRPDLPAHEAVVPRPNALLPARVQELARRSQSAKPSVVFLGDSITQFWEKEGQPVWEEHYASSALNLGCGWDQTQNVLWRIEQGHIDRLQPKVFVLLIGTNNTRYGEHSPPQIADGVAAIVTQLRRRAPESQVLLLGILPRGASPTDPWRRNNEEANILLRGLAAADALTFLDLGEHFLEPDGALRTGVMHDGLHLTELGYRTWAENMNGVLQRMLEE